MLFQNIFSADRNELMRERMRLEKAQKNNAKEVENSKDSRTQQKRKNSDDALVGQNKRKKQTEGNKENEQKAKDDTNGQKKKKQTEGNKKREQKTKEREEKRKKKEEDQERQKLILEARKAQAASRLVTSSNSQAEPEVTIIIYT